MGKVMITVFFISLFVATLYMTTLFSYVVLYIEDSFLEPSLSSLPMRSQMLWLKGAGPFLFLTVMPLSLIVGFFSFVCFSMNRWKGAKREIGFDPIKKPLICVALTAYNDQESIYPAILDFRSQQYVTSVIVVDNNSSDLTGKRAAEAGALVVRENNQGYGWACMRGLREAMEHSEANIVALCEGDGTFSADDLRKMVPYLDNVDMVLGTRTTQELLAQRSQLDWFYVWGNLFLAKLVQIKFWDVKHWGRVRLTDVGCTFRVLRREALDYIIDHLSVGGDHFSPHMTMVAIEKGLRVVEVPITFRERVGISKGAGANKKRAMKVGLGMLWHILSF